MNIFALSNNPKLAASYHCDKHVNKMAIETTQMLSWAYYHYFGYDPNASKREKGRALRKFRKYLKKRNFPREAGFYKISKSHWNHPCTKWVRRSKQNWAWTVALGLNLCYEFRWRYRKTHACEALLKWMQRNVIALPDRGLTARPQCIDDIPIIKGKPVRAYRQYYMLRKSNIARWDRNRDQPFWWKPESL